jgi:hypothetical protein
MQYSRAKKKIFTKKGAWKLILALLALIIGVFILSRYAFSGKTESIDSSSFISTDNVHYINSFELTSKTDSTPPHDICADDNIQAESLYQDYLRKDNAFKGQRSREFTPEEWEKVKVDQGFVSVFLDKTDTEKYYEFRTRIGRIIQLTRIHKCQYFKPNPKGDGGINLDKNSSSVLGEFMKDNPTTEEIKDLLLYISNLYKTTGGPKISEQINIQYQDQKSILTIKREEGRSGDWNLPSRKVKFNETFSYNSSDKSITREYKISFW